MFSFVFLCFTSHSVGEKSSFVFLIGRLAAYIDVKEFSKFSFLKKVCRNVKYKNNIYEQQDYNDFVILLPHAHVMW